MGGEHFKGDSTVVNDIYQNNSTSSKNSPNVTLLGPGLTVRLISYHCAKLPSFDRTAEEDGCI